MCILEIVTIMQTFALIDLFTMLRERDGRRKRDERIGMSVSTRERERMCVC